MGCGWDGRPFFSAIELALLAPVLGCSHADPKAYGNDELGTCRQVRSMRRTPNGIASDVFDCGVRTNDDLKGRDAAVIVTADSANV